MHKSVRERNTHNAHPAIRGSRRWRQAYNLGWREWRRPDKPKNTTRTAREEWGYSNDQAELDDWRWHITKELARERIIEKKD